MIFPTISSCVLFEARGSLLVVLFVTAVIGGTGSIYSIQHPAGFHGVEAVTGAYLYRERCLFLKDLISEHIKPSAPEFTVALCSFLE
jgi:hypothetical protein